MGDQGDIDLLQGIQATVKHVCMRSQICRLHAVQGDGHGAPRAQIGCHLSQFLAVACHQEELAALRGPQARASSGDG
ncbi:hypothetical protein D3C78_1491950 [compost metagenome]